MKHTLVYAVFLLFTAFLAGSAMASCPTAPVGPYYIGFSEFYDYSPDPSCVTISGNITSTTINCGEDGYSYGTVFPTETVSYTFTADPNKTLSTWSAGSTFQFSDPNDSWWDQINMQASVLHNGSWTNTTLFSHYGSDGTDYTSCAGAGGTFHAVGGDTITISITVSKEFANALIQSGYIGVVTESP